MFQCVSTTSNVLRLVPGYADVADGVPPRSGNT